MIRIIFVATLLVGSCQENAMAPVISGQLVILQFVGYNRYQHIRIHWIVEIHYWTRIEQSQKE